ncbi:MAG: hypothetical protein M3R36_01130 [Bacteroidota bacterium]|nr:hypothetical protein [Bacteroidota bacterium]
MYKIKLFYCVIIIFLFAVRSHGQVRPSLQLTFGLAFPGENFAGELVSANDSGISNINPDFIKNNYATSTGATVTGTLKFPIGQSGLISGLFMGSYTYFSAFRRSVLATSIQNGVAVSGTYDNRFSTTTFGFGIEATPLPNSKFSPFINSSFTLNILSLSLKKDDFITALFNDAFRMGVLTNAGLTISLNDEYSLVIGGSYHLSNLFLKSNSSDFEDRITNNRESLPINDKGGEFYTNLSNPGLFPSLVNGTDKNVNWWNLNIGLNILLGKSNKK